MGWFGKKKEPLSEEEEKAVEETMNAIQHAMSERRAETGEDEVPEEEKEEEEEEEEVDEQDEEVKIIIKDAAIMVAIATMVANATSAIPGLGTVAGVLFGMAVSSGLMAKIQGEMVRDIAKVYGKELSPDNQQRAMAAIYGISRGVTQGVKEVGTRVATQTTSKAVSYIPMVGALTAASVNMTVTYVIGHRAKAYYKLGPEQMGSWEETVRAVSGIDELKMSVWMNEALQVIKAKAMKAPINAPKKRNS
mmetsp:Transcript_411/g.556  ORF Transcript_411/g.556 Transcript_411/m.556 type:complete len:249 (+) Transcript_411:263-1009(+)